MAAADYPSPAPEDAAPARSRDHALLAQLYHRLAVAIRARWPGPDVEDVVQDAFLRLLLAESRTEIHDKPAFLYVTAVNLVRDRIRADVARGTLLVDAEHLERIMSDAPSTEQILDARERLAIADAAIAELPESARAALVMFRLENLSQARIAEELSVSVSMVEKHVRRAVTHVRDRLAEADDA